jgi:hypothetical protein
MTWPTVTEQPRRLEPVIRDPFMDAPSRVRETAVALPQPPVRSLGIGRRTRRSPHPSIAIPTTNPQRSTDVS